MMRQVEIRSKTGRPYWVFGVPCSPDEGRTFTIVDSDERPRGERWGEDGDGTVTQAEFNMVKKLIDLKVSEGGTLLCNELGEGEPATEAAEPVAITEADKLRAHTVTDLRATAATYGVDLPPRALKEEIIDLILTAQNAASGESFDLSDEEF